MIEIYQYQFKVGPESIDILKHVNNREYLRWMEKAAMEHASLLGCGAKECLQRGVGKASAAKGRDSGDNLPDEAVVTGTCVIWIIPVSGGLGVRPAIPPVKPRRQ